MWTIIDCIYCYIFFWNSFFKYDHMILTIHDNNKYRYQNVSGEI